MDRREPPPPVAKQLLIELTWTDGSTEKLDAVQCLLQPGLIVFTLAKGGDYCIPLTSLRCWRARQSGLVIAVPGLA